MTTPNDLFKRVNFTAGQEARAADFVDVGGFGKAWISDAILEKLIPGPGASNPDTNQRVSLNALNGANVDSSGAPYRCYALSGGSGYPRRGTLNNRVGMAPGTLFQKVAVADGNDESLLAFTFDGTEEYAIANGDPTNPRIDILQMRLQLVSTDSQARVFDNPGLPASIDMDPLCTNFDTVFQAKARGTGGNQITVRTITGGAAAYSESGFAVTLTYQTGVTTVAAIEALVTANSTLIEIQAIGTPANVLSSPGDTVAATNLAGGSNDQLVSANFNVKKRVQATLSIKQGTPAASPAYPVPDAGYVIVAGVFVGPNYAGAAPLQYDDAAGAVAVLHDQRVPMGGVRGYKLFPKDFMYDATDWTLSTDMDYITAGASTSYLRGVCRAGSQIGRVLAVQYVSKDGDSATRSLLVRYRLSGSGTSAVRSMNELFIAATNTDWLRLTAHSETFDENHDPAAGATISNTGPMGAPVWTNGHRCIAPEIDEADPGQYDHDDTVCFMLSGTIPNGTKVGAVTFYVAEGI